MCVVFVCVVCMKYVYACGVCGMVCVLCVHVVCMVWCVCVCVCERGREVGWREGERETYGHCEDCMGKLKNGESAISGIL